MYKDMIDTIGYVKQADPELGEAMDRELGRQRQNIELIASENIVSPAVMAAMGSVLTNKYAEGYPGHRYYGGCQFVDEVEQIAIDRACKLFGAKYANVQPHSGAQANLAVYFALLTVGDTVMGMDLSQGGHLTHGSPVNMSGKNYNFVSYGVSTEDGRIDYAALAKQVAKVRPKLIVAGASAYPRAIDFEKLAEIAHGYGAMLMVDMAHIAGLVAGGQHQSPVPYADVVTTTTHKTLRGPRGGLILTNNEYIIKRINSAIFPGTQGGPLEHVIAAKAVCFGEALKPEFKEYARKIVENAKALEAELTARGVKLVSGGTDNHLMLVDLARNDLARICTPGSRYVADLTKVDRYSFVMHLVSRVVGELRQDLDVLHAYRACMNMGTLSGAPKVRAMQLIAAAEGKRRGSYGGAVGYFTAHGDLDTCIVIRSAYVQEGIATVQAGAGIVLDSVPQSEADETRNKARAVLRAIAQAHHAKEIF